MFNSWNADWNNHSIVEKKQSLALGVTRSFGGIQSFGGIPKWKPRALNQAEAGEKYVVY